MCLCVGVYMCVCMCPQKPEGMNIPGTWVKSSLRAHPTWLLWIELRSSAEVIHGLTAEPCPLEYFYDVYYGMSLGWRLMQGPLCSPGTASQVWGCRCAPPHLAQSSHVFRSWGLLNLVSPLLMIFSSNCSLSICVRSAYFDKLLACFLLYPVSHRGTCDHLLSGW